MDAALPDPHVPIIAHDEPDVKSTTPPVRAMRALELLIAAEGNLKLAAELGGCKDHPELIINAIVHDENNHDMLSRYVRAFTIMKTFSLMTELQDHVLNAVAEEKVKPHDLIKLFGDSIELLSRLTDSKTSTQNINVFETINKTLPPDVREALTLLNGGKSA